MRVADFFCGAGGFSEGFRQAGFDIVFALDKWSPAVQTYRGNKPTTKVVQDDIIRVANLPDDEFHKLIPNTEVIIGSPPCVAFSSSNKSGNGDKALGMKLLKSFLRIVARKKYMEGSVLKYWILENVPNVERHLKAEYSFAELGLSGEGTLQVFGASTAVYNAKYFGTPSNRKRFLCGEFPVPVVTHEEKEVVPMRRVLEALGLPLAEDRVSITDCNYKDLTLDLESVTDHQYEYIVADFESEKARRLKQDKGYMGRMSFPEDPNRPARTIMATMSTSARESMILGMPDGRYRLPTVRELASMMGFPLDYRFYGQSKGIKYTLVGNAVPPKLSYAVAIAIAQEEGMDIPSSYIRIVHDNEIPFHALNWTEIPIKQEKPKRYSSKFKYHIPYTIIKSYRVELTNHHSDFHNNRIRWCAEVHYSQGKSRLKVFTPPLLRALIPDKINASINIGITTIGSLMCSAQALQDRHCMTSSQRKGQVGPYELLSLLKKFLDDHVSDESIMIELAEEPYLLPIKIYVGYFMLQSILEYGGDIGGF